MAKPIVFQDKGKIYYADSCEPLKAAARLGELYLRGWARGNYPGVQLPRNMLPQLRSIGVWDATRPQRWGLDLHCNEGIEFTYVARGKTAFEVRRQELVVAKRRSDNHSALAISPGRQSPHRGQPPDLGDHRR
jgi:hypothetical protein